MDSEAKKILELLIDEDIYEYKCFDTLKEKITTDKEFRETIKKGIEKGKIEKFPRELFNKVCNQNIRAPFDMVQIFIDGANFGDCTKMSLMVSYSLPVCEICGGTLDILKGTKNSEDGSHTWISYNGWIIDTSLMITISESIKEELHYNEENRYNPNIDERYIVSKEYANDDSIKTRKK